MNTMKLVGIHPLIDFLNDSRLTLDLRFLGNISFQIIRPKALKDLSPYVTLYSGETN